MTDVLLITNSFPFFSGEEFIETEIKYLVKTNKVTILPLTQGGIARCVLEARVDLRLAGCNKFTFKKLVNLLRSRYLYTEILLKPAVLLSWSHFKKTLYYIYAGENIAKELESYIGNIENKEVLIYSYWANQSALAGAILKQSLPTLRAITRCHRYDLYRGPGDGFMPLNKGFLNGLDATYPCSENGSNYLLSEYGVSHNKVFTARLGTEDYGCGQGFNRRDTLHIVSCSYLVPVKRVALIIDSLALIENFKQVIWTHIGDGELKEELKAKAEAELNHVQVCWMGDLSNTAVLDFYRANKIDCFINVSSSEGVPVSIMEAISFGIPAVAMDVGGVAEIVSEDNGALLKGDASALEVATAIVDVKGRNSTEFRKQVKEVWRKKYCAEKNYNNFLLSLTKLFER